MFWTPGEGISTLPLTTDGEGQDGGTLDLGAYTQGLTVPPANYGVWSWPEDVTSLDVHFLMCKIQSILSISYRGWLEYMKYKVWK